MTDQHYLRIVPATRDGEGATPTRGTHVFAGDTQIRGVTGITLRADVNDVWRATIECNVKPPAELLAQARVVLINTPWWRRALHWITGEPRDVTSLAHEYRAWERW
jgi:hypothetical protein